MKTRKAYISIIALLIMSILVIMTLYLGYTIKLEYLTLSSSNNNTQSYYQSEGKVLMSIYDESYYNSQLYPMLTQYFRTFPNKTTLKDIIICNEDLGYDDKINRVKVNIIESNKRKELSLISESECNGIRTIINSSISLFNELFERGDPILSLNSIEKNNKKDLEILLEKISNDINIDNLNKSTNVFGTQSTNYNEIILHKNNSSSLELLSHKLSMVNPKIERFCEKEVIIIVKSSGEEISNLTIGKETDLNEMIEISGVIYVEGNIIISSNFKFNGIIIVKGGEIIVESNEKPYIKGMVIIDDLLDYDLLTAKLDVVYDRYYIYKYGTYLPGFIDLKINVIKSN